jgi:hypothetical protein
MPDLKRKLTGPVLATGVAALCFLSPFYIPRSVLPFGFSFFFCWAALCIAAVLADRLLVWAFLSCSALLAVSIDWWSNGPPVTDDFGFGALDAIALFLGTALVVAGTGVLSIVRTRLHARPNGS